MRELEATLLQREALWGAVARLRLQAPGLGPVAPGQYMLLGLTGRRDPLLARPVLVSGQDRTAGTVDALGSDPEDGRWTPVLAAMHERFRLVGPAGRPFAVEGRSRHALLIGGGLGTGPLLYLAHKLVDQGHEVTFVGVRDAEGRTVPGSLFPPEVEFVAPLQSQGDQQTGPLAAVDTLIPWADQLFVALPEIYLPGLLTLLRRRLLRLRKGFAQALVLPDLLPCGLGACDLCALRTRDGYRRPCRDGLVFDLLALA